MAQLVEQIVGYTSLSLGGITLLTSIFVLSLLCTQKSFRFVRAMVIIMTIVSIMEVCYGAVLLFWFMEVEQVKNNAYLYYISAVTILIAMADFGSLTIIWFVTFKYWETARQFSRLLRLQKSKTDHKSDSNELIDALPGRTTSIDMNLSTKHSKYACYKWTGFSIITILSLV